MRGTQTWDILHYSMLFYISIIYFSRFHIIVFMFSWASSKYCISILDKLLKFFKDGYILLLSLVAGTRTGWIGALLSQIYILCVAYKTRYWYPASICSAILYRLRKGPCRRNWWQYSRMHSHYFLDFWYFKKPKINAFARLEVECLTTVHKFWFKVG